MEIRGTASDDFGIVSLSIAANYAVAEPVDVTPGESVTFAIPIDVEAGENVAVVRATDAAGNVQPLQPVWDVSGFGNNAVQRVQVDVGR